MQDILLERLITPDRLHQRYDVEDFISYCREIADRLRVIEAIDMKAYETFKKKRFFGEMVPLSKICHNDFHPTRHKRNEIQVQYLQKDPPDAIIIDGRLQVTYSLEFTTSADMRLFQ